MQTQQSKSTGRGGAFLIVVLATAMAIVAAVAQDAKSEAASRMALQLHQALSLAEHGDRQQAMAVDLQLLQQNPKFVPAIKLRGMLLEESGQVKDAAAVYEEGYLLAPKDPDLLLKTGISKLVSGDREEALKRLERCVKIIPTDGDANFYLAQAYHLNGHDDLALPAIRAALKAEPDNSSVWQKYGELLCSNGDCANAVRWLLKAQHADPTLPRIDFDIAAADFKLMDLAGAAGSAERAVSLQPKDDSALELLATANLKLARWQEAEAAFQKLQALKGDDPDTLLGLGQCQVELKNYGASVETLTSVLRIDPTRVLAHFYLSRAFAGLGKTAEAQHEAALHQLMMEQLTFARSIETDQRENPIRTRCQQLLSSGQEDAAVKLYQEHFKGTSATTADAYVFVGKLYLFMGKTEDGLRCLHHALQLQSTVRGAHTYEGILALKQGDLARAEREFSDELTNDPSSQLAIAEMGEVRYHQERWSDAADYLAKSRTTTPELLYMLCDSYFHLGKTEEADLNAEALAAYARNQPQVMEGLNNLLTRNGQSDLAKRLTSEQSH